MACKILKGTVASNKMQKAIVVNVITTKIDPIYKKRVKVKKRYSVSCADSAKYNVGDEVQIQSCRPISKTISFKVIE